VRGGGSVVMMVMVEWCGSCGDGGDSGADSDNADPVTVVKVMMDAFSCFTFFRPPSPDPSCSYQLQVLRGFWRAHAAQLRTIPIRDASVMNKYLPYMEQFRAAYDRIKNIETEWEKQSFVQLRSAVMGQDAFSELDNNDQDVLKDFKYDNFQAKTLEDMILLGELVGFFA
jgi:hypothetical protein